MGKEKKSAKSVTANPCGGSHGLTLLFGCSKCQKIKKAAAKRQTAIADERRRNSGTPISGLVKDAEWHSKKSIQKQFPNGW